MTQKQHNFRWGYDDDEDITIPQSHQQGATSDLKKNHCDFILPLKQVCISVSEHTQQLFIKKKKSCCFLRAGRVIFTDKLFSKQLRNVPFYIPSESNINSVEIWNIFLPLPRRLCDHSRCMTVILAAGLRKTVPLSQWCVWASVKHWAISLWRNFRRTEEGCGGQFRIYGNMFI